jgi:hypothetical protein
MYKKVTNAKNKIARSSWSLIIFLFLLTVLMTSLVSCSGTDLISVFTVVQDNTQRQDNQTTETQKTEEKINVPTNAEFDFFDYSKIKTETTSAIDLKLKNSNLYLDNFNDLVLLGEIHNDSNTSKTNIEITIEVFNEKGEIIFGDKISSLATYLRPRTKVPYVYYFNQKDQYINIYSIKIGINYKNYFERFKSNVVVLNEKFHYLNEGTRKEMFEVSGRVVNLGESKAKNIHLLATFYNLKGQVVFVKKCYIPEDSINALEHQDFSLRVLLDKNTPTFTNYSFEVFFEDELTPLA